MDEVYALHGHSAVEHWSDSAGWALQGGRGEHRLKNMDLLKSSNPTVTVGKKVASGADEQQYSASHTKTPSAVLTAGSS